MKKRRLSYKFSRSVRAVYILSLSVIVTLLLAFTRYAPDAYVFIRYAWQDNYLRTVGLHSITDNNVLFDVATVFFDLVGITELGSYLVAVVAIYILIFYLKYFHFFAQVSLSRLSLIYTASLMTYDLNQLRFQLSLLLFLYTFSSSISGARFWLLRCLSLLTHLLPAIVFYTARFRYLPLLALPGLVLLMELAGSRFIFYFTPVEFVPFKVFLLVIPNVIAFLYYKKSRDRNKIAEFAFSFNVLFMIFIAFNGALAARFLEAGFYLYVIWWCLSSSRSRILGSIFWVFSLSMLASRLYGGISAGSSASFFF